MTLNLIANNLLNRLIMLKLSTIRKPLLVLILALFALKAWGGEQSWPVHGKIELSSGFCDFRVAHFHGGLDIRTGGAEGRQVFSPVDGYVWRIRYSYTGYGKAFYIKDNDGFIFVFGHLSRLSDRFEKLVENEQYRLKRYYLDWQFPVDSLPVKRGDLVAFSGQTGAGPPHLHFERRTPSNQPLNPLTNGYPLSDNIPPKIEAAILYYQDSCSLFPGGKRSKRLNLHFDRGREAYVIDSILYLSSPFGIGLKTFDQIEPHGPKLNIYKAQLFLDGIEIPWYEFQLDRYDYDETKMVNLTYDYLPAAKNKDYRYLLFEPKGKKFSGSKFYGDYRGVIGGYKPEYQGLHTAHVEIFDAAGNMSKLFFSYILAPANTLFDSEISGDSILFLRSRTDLAKADLKEVRVYGYAPQSGWHQIANKLVGQSTSLEAKIPLMSAKSKPVALKIERVGRSGWRNIENYIFLDHRQEHKYRFDYELDGGGILFDIASQDPYAPPPTINAVCEDSSTMQIESEPLSLNKYIAYFESYTLTSKIIRFDLLDADGKICASRNANIILAGRQTDSLCSNENSDFGISFDSSCFYAPSFIELQESQINYSASNITSSKAYQITPEIFPLANDITVHFEKDRVKDLGRIGIGKLTATGSWQWIKASLLVNWLTAKSSRLGTFALLTDSEPPRILNVSPSDGSSVSSSFSKISCNITDNLSGIENDENISVSLDGKWLIPEYDPETTQLKTYPKEKLVKGKHQLEIIVSDRAGNTRIIKTTFYLKAK